MRGITTIPFFLFLTTFLVAQQRSNIPGMEAGNIIPNPGFELYSGSPIGWFYKGAHFTEVMKYWQSPTSASPDVFGPKVRVPAHWAEKGFGEQSPYAGTSMVGITCYGCRDGKPHCREYIQIQLSEPLVNGQNYYLEMWVSHLPRSLQINNLGAHFSTERLSLLTDDLLNVSPQIVSRTVIEAPAPRWRKLSGYFTATSEAEFLTIGNFSPDSLTHIQPPGEDAFNYAYYYIDELLLRKEEPILEVPVPEDDLSRVELAEGRVIQLRHIYFETDKYELLPRSYLELQKLLALMRKNPGMAIEIRGHTDQRGDKAYNEYLSRKRAEAVANYLLENGIDPQRVRHKGFGESMPIANNRTEAGMQLNRRVEFLILKK